MTAERPHQIEGPTPLERVIADEIARTGPISIARFMSLCLGHPEHGYYRRRDPLGADGDFTTAPQISQIFGELIGLWAIQVWRDQGAPTPVVLVELGPGRGTLMADALRVIAQAAPDFHNVVEVVLVETSPALRARQAAALPTGRPGGAPQWFDRLEDAPDLPMLLIANEFFDALPIHRFVRDVGPDASRPEAWREQLVRLGDPFTLALSEAPVDLAVHAGAGPATARRIEALGLASIETQPEGWAIAAEIGARLAKRGGGALWIDYGYDSAALARNGGADTLQAVRAHRFADPMKAPGLADLTAHVDFDALAAAAVESAKGGATAHPLVTQGSFLRRLGAEARAATLARRTPAQAETIAAALHRLTHPSEMGRLFRAKALTPNGAPTPPGFEEGDAQ